jgi:RNA polymerase sigma-70 factor (ECF subfamily)
MIHDLSDEQLAVLVQDGQNEIFGILIDRYEAKMLRYARKFLFNKENAEDQVQEVFIKAYTNIATFKSYLKFSPWLYRIAHNCFINEIKKNRREPLIFFDPDTIFPQILSKSSSDTVVLDNELKQSLSQCLDKININYKEILILYFFEELSYKEIADVLHISVSLAGIRLNRAKIAVKKNIKL